MTKADTLAKQERARSIIESIAKDHGYLGEDVYAKMNAKARRQIQEVLLRKNEMLGASIVTLVKNMRDDQFIFELLKNADENSFLRARAIGIEPYVSFNLYKDRIIIECNEDGFNESDVRAICNIGRSSKVGLQGMGFKSVFRVAYKAHIQSGHYSFSFTHREGDSGMGMISPECEETAPASARPLARTSLYLHDADGDESQRRRIIRHFKRFDSAILLSLKSIKKIEVRIHDGDGSEVSSCLFPILFHNGFERIYTRDGDTTLIKQKNHVVSSATESDSDSEDEHSEPETLSTDCFSLNPSIRNNVQQRIATIQEYRAFLSQVAMAARYSRVLGDTESIQTDQDLSETQTFKENNLFHDSLTQAERDRRAEAAGQLYVFELLSSLCPRFNGRHWTSTLRKYVAIHPDYEDMGSWTGTENADFEYKDINGILTKALVDRGHLPNKWRKQLPRAKYYIKVKATAGAWDEPFFIESDDERQKMIDLSTDESIYVIFRVFNLYSGDVDCKIYVNPIKEDSLDIEGDRWIVRRCFAE
ncbi:hypothetical protein F5Y13DRAFT_50483 [Hypoxylon sp. FL1857]|nr:hypothetical protein F5Y13DRAFT_50483 [Hypoxylon sp. FL1857]